MTFWHRLRSRFRAFWGEGRAGGVWIAALAANLFVVGVFVSIIHKEYQDQEAKAVLIGENLSRVLDRGLSGVVDKIDLMLLAVVDDVEAAMRDSAAARTLAVQPAKYLPEVMGINVVDADGAILSGNADTGQVESGLSAAPYFRTLRDTPDSGLVVSGPMNGQIFIMPIIVFARAYDKPDGSFGGIVTATVAVKSLLGLLASVDVGPHGNVSLWGARMGLLARYSPQPTTSAVKTALPPKLAALIRQGSGPSAFHIPVDFDGIERIAFFRPVSGWPLFLLVGVSADDYLGRPRSLALLLSGLGGLFALGSFASSFAFSRMFRTLRTNETRLRLAMAAAHQGWFEAWMPQGLVTTSPEYARMLGFQTEAFHPNVQDWIAGIHPEDRAKVRYAFDLCLEEGSSPLDIDYRCLTADGSWLWIHTMGQVVERDAAGRSVRLIGTHTDISERKKSEQRIEELAYFDPLTQLPNRRLLLDRINQAVIAGARTQSCGGVLFVDLDNFKSLNDSHGHGHGDLLLREAARRLTKSIRESDAVGRLGGDEFVIVLPSLGENVEAAVAHMARIADKVLAEMSRPYRIKSHDVHLTASVGGDIFRPHPRIPPEELLRHADIAMYNAKSAGGNRLQVFSPIMQAAVAARAALEKDLRAALAADEFILHYQPQIEDGRVVGAEALVRWNHPARGMVSPGDFIPVAEETGMILSLGDWVLRAACAQIATWRESLETCDLFVSVNVSPYQLHQPDFVPRVLAALRESGAEPERLKIEITESALIENSADTIAKMKVLKAEGIRFSLDDFGTGYASLSYLKTFPFDQLKIDQSFVSGIQDDVSKGAIAKTVVMLGRFMELSVIAEGVETREQMDYLAAIGCRSFQGYLFGRPLPAEAFLETLAAR